MVVIGGDEARHLARMGWLVLLGRRKSRWIAGIPVIVFAGVIASGVSGAWCATSNLSVKWAFDRSNVFPGLSYGSGYLCPPTVFDIDGDGHNEILWGSRTGDPERMWCISDAGIFEWVFPPIDQDPLPGDPRSKVSLVDVDGDGVYELAFAGAGGLLHVIDGNGGLVWRWENAYGEPVMAGPPQAYDVDGDGYPEFFMNDYWGNLHRIDREGNLVWSWSGGEGGDNLVHPTICDIDQDGEYELLAPNHDGTLYCISAEEGETVWSYDTGVRMYHNPVIVADINGDQRYEALVWNQDGAVICLDQAGGLVWRWTLPGEYGIRYSQPIGDLDRDGSLDMVVMSEAGIFCIDIGGESPSVKWEVNVSVWSEEGLLPEGALVHRLTTYHLIADIDGDDELEVLLLVPFPVVIDGATGSLESYYMNEKIAVGRRPENGGWWGDVEGDGVSEWICDLNGKGISYHDTLLYCLTANGRYPAESPWPEYYHSSLPPQYQLAQGLPLISAYSNSLWFPLEAYEPSYYFSVSVYTDRDLCPQGQTVAVTARVTNASRPVTDALVEFKVIRPDLDEDGPFPMYDDGTHGDTTPGDGVYSAEYSIEADFALGKARIEVNATQNGLTASQGRTIQVIDQGPGVHNVNTGESFAAIQEAIDDPDTVDGHTIVVQSGTYRGRVLIDKAIHLKGLDTGEGRPCLDLLGQPVPSPGAGRDTVTLTADGITLEGFEIMGSSGWMYAAIRVKSGNNTISQNVVHANDNAVYLDHSAGNTVTNNEFYDNDFHAVYLNRSGGNTISGNNIGRGEDAAILLENSDGNSLVNNSIAANWYGIRLVSSSSNTITNNSGSQCRIGMHLYSSHGNVISQNDLSHNEHSGAIISESNNNEISGNLMEENHRRVSGWGTGLRLGSSTGCVLESNTMSGNAYNIWITGSNHSHFNNQIDQSNTVDGKPIHYLMGLSNLVIDSSSRAGVVYCINCTHITIEGLSISNEGVGIFLYNTNSSVVRNNQIQLNWDSAISVLHSNNNTVSENVILHINGSVNPTGILIESSNTTKVDHNQITDTGYGVLVQQSQGATVLGNNLSQCDDGAIWLLQADENRVLENTITSSYETIHLTSSDENTIANNTVRYNRRGMDLSRSSWNTITYNIVQGSHYWGIRLRAHSNHNEISWNEVVNNGDSGIKLDEADGSVVTGNTVRGNGPIGIYLRSSIDNEILDNNVSGSNQGIQLADSQCNTITGNTITQNGRAGIGLDDSESNLIALNHVEGSLNSINVKSSSQNRIYLNVFNSLTGLPVSQYNSENTWDTARPVPYRFDGGDHVGELGNHWGDYQGVDQDGDGIGESVYTIDTDEDQHPLVEGPERYELLEDLSLDLAAMESECLLDAAAQVIEEAKYHGMDTAQEEAMLERAHEEFEKGNYDAVKEYTTKIISLRSEIGEGFAHTIILLGAVLFAMPIRRPSSLKAAARAWEQ